MNKITALGILLLVFIACSRPMGQTNLKETSDKNTSKFSFLDEHLEGKKIVALGESTHGIGDYYQLKAELVQYLYEELGFEILALEGGMGDINLAWMEIEGLSSKELRNKTAFGNFQCKEIEPLFDLIKEKSAGKRPLIYTGFDCQTSSSFFRNRIDSILQMGDEKLVEKFDAAFDAYFKIFPAAYESDSTIFITHRDVFLKGVGAAMNFIAESEDRIHARFNFSEQQMKIITRSLESLWKSMDIKYSERFTEENHFAGIVLRDQLMFENLIWLLEEFYPDKKVIIWGHNGHIQKGKVGNSNTKWMGQLLKETYGDSYYSLGIFAYKGNFYNSWTKESFPFENADSTFIEYRLQTSEQNKLAFQNLNDQSPNKNNAWMFNSTNALEPESMGVINFIPVERFDGVIGLWEVDIPTFD